jgi:hypothetical protein
VSNECPSIVIGSGNGAFHHAKNFGSLYPAKCGFFDKEVISCGVDRRKNLFDVTNYEKLECRT